MGERCQALPASSHCRLHPRGVKFAHVEIATGRRGSATHLRKRNASAAGRRARCRCGSRKSQCRWRHRWGQWRQWRHLTRQAPGRTPEHRCWRRRCRASGRGTRGGCGIGTVALEKQFLVGLLDPLTAEGPEADAEAQGYREDDHRQGEDPMGQVWSQPEAGRCEHRCRADANEIVSPPNAETAQRQKLQEHTRPPIAEVDQVRPERTEEHRQREGLRLRPPWG
mmetsp:Transcript_123860/g.263958  ORF Transcript_123860/g.263958 Transcript_123860/m.263958 type:complete len:224 (+) Transcript_123860:51-722(+)